MAPYRVVHQQDHLRHFFNKDKEVARHRWPTAAKASTSSAQPRAPTTERTAGLSRKTFDEQRIESRLFRPTGIEIC
jgi:hypothetical protein